MSCPLCEQVRRCRGEGDPSFIAALPHSFVVLGSNQGLRGWCVLILREHREHLAELPSEVQREVFGEVARVAAAIRAVFPSSGIDGGPPRINYECLGNQVNHVHWHVIPRHADDPDLRNAVWGIPAETLRGTMGEIERRALVEELRGAIVGSD